MVGEVYVSAEFATSRLFADFLDTRLRGSCTMLGSNHIVQHGSGRSRHRIFSALSCFSRAASNESPSQHPPAGILAYVHKCSKFTTLFGHYVQLCYTIEYSSAGAQELSETQVWRTRKTEQAIMSNTAEIMERYREVMFPAATPYHGDNPLVTDRAKDQYIWDIEGGAISISSAASLRFLLVTAMTRSPSAHWRSCGSCSIRRPFTSMRSWCGWRRRWRN